MSIDSNATTNIATDGAIDFRNIIPLVVISRRVYTLIPAPDILIGVDRNVAAYRIIALNAGIGCKAVACAHDGPVAVQPQSLVRVLVVRRTGDDMQVAADDGRIDELLRAADLVGPAGTNVQRHIAPHLTAVSAFN